MREVHVPLSVLMVEGHAGSRLTHSRWDKYRSSPRPLEPRAVVSLPSIVAAWAIFVQYSNARIGQAGRYTGELGACRRVG